MVSEDSASRRWFAVVHRLDDALDLGETKQVEMATLLHEFEHFRELPEVLVLRRQERILLEERNNDLAEIDEPPHHVPVQRLAMVVPSLVAVDPSAAEEVSHRLESCKARSSLDDDELRLHLPAQCRPDVALDRHAEATFTIDEPDNPTCESQSFLLIVRTRHVVTIVNVRADGTMSSAGYSDVPAYSRLHRPGSLLTGATVLLLEASLDLKGHCHLRTVHCCYTFERTFPLEVAGTFLTGSHGRP